MSWFFFSLVGPFLYALTNHIDKVLLEKYLTEKGVGTLILFSALLSVLAIPFILLIDSGVMEVERSSIGYLAIVSALNLLVLWAYLMALKEDEATIIIVFYQLVPVFGGLMGYFLLNEVLSRDQLTAMAVVMLGTSIVSIKFEGRHKLRFRARTVFFMVLASFCWGLETTIFKGVALEENVWRSVFWEHVSMVVLGILIFALIPGYRRSFVATWKMNSSSILSLNLANETLYMVGNITVAYAIMLAPIALILLAESFQVFFVFLIGATSTLLFPEVYREQLDRQIAVQKLSSIAITGYGVYWLVSITP